MTPVLVTAEPGYGTRIFARPRSGPSPPTVCIPFNCMTRHVSPSYGALGSLLDRDTATLLLLRDAHRFPKPSSGVSVNEPLEDGVYPCGDARFLCLSVNW